MPLSASVKSAFSSYVRSGCRGEPDGRTAVGGDSRGRESDAAFTPSPVDPVHRTSNLFCIGKMRFLFQINSFPFCSIKAWVIEEDKVVESLACWPVCPAVPEAIEEFQYRAYACR